MAAACLPFGCVRIHIFASMIYVIAQLPFSGIFPAFNETTVHNIPTVCLWRKKRAKMPARKIETNRKKLARILV